MEVVLVTVVQTMECQSLTDLNVWLIYPQVIKVLHHAFVIVVYV